MKRNLFPYLTAFFCGMSVMAVELSASRLLATTFSSSSIVWTVVIGLIMISLSLGNVWGGRMSDKLKNGDKLYLLISLASVWVAVMAIAGKYIIDLTVAILTLILPSNLSNNLIISGSVISCLIIFSFPLVILGMVTPFQIKLSVTDMVNNGKTTGEIYALSTVGSIIGTFIPTFLTIPTIGTSNTFFVFAFILNMLSLYYFISKKKKVVRALVSTLIILILAFAPFSESYAFWENNIIYEGESIYNYLKVTETEDTVALSTNVAFGVQSLYKKNSILTGYYYDYALMAPFFIKDTNFDKSLDTLILGLGTGTYAKMCKRFFPNTLTDGVEIDQKIVDLSKKFFELKDTEATIYVNDGRAFLKSKDVKKYNLIMVDAYRDITIPFHMTTREFFGQVKKHLNPGGVLVININMHSEKNTEITDYLTETVKSVMPKVYKCDMDDGTNTLVFASEDINALQNFKTNIAAIPKNHTLYNIVNFVDKNLSEVTKSSHVLTDEVAPVELMGQKVLDEIVGKELNYFKGQLKSSKNGIWDLFNLIGS